MRIWVLLASAAMVLSGCLGSDKAPEPAAEKPVDNISHLGIGDGKPEEASWAPEIPTPATLFFHVNGFQMFPINTQMPSDQFKEAARYGATSHSTSCVADNAALGEFHTFYGYSSPSIVEYDVQVNGKPITHPERGVSYTGKLDQGEPFTLHWFLEIMPSNTEADQVPLALPKVTVKATMRTGDAIGIDKADLDAGDPIAEGKVTGALAGPLTSTVNQALASEGITYHNTTSSGRHVYGFKIPMTYQSAEIPRETGYNIRIDAFVENEACPNQGGYVMPNVVAVHSSPELRPRMELTVLNPLRVEAIHPQFVGGDLVVHTLVNSVWGSYDVDEGQLGLAIEGPSTPSEGQLNLATVLDHVQGHGSHQEPLMAVFVWKYTEDAGQPGEYTVTLDITNDQGNARVSAVRNFSIGDI